MKKNQLISLLVFLIIIVGIIITLLLVSYFVPIKQERGCNVQGPFTCKEVKVFTQEQLDQQNYVLLEATDVQELRIIPESIRMSTCINAYLDQSSLINSGNKEVKIILECPIGVENETIIGSLEILYMTLKGDVKKAKLMFNVRRVKPLVKRIADDFVEGIVKITKAGSNTGSRGGGGGGGGVEPLPIILGLDSENPLIIAAGQSYNIGDLVNTFYFILGEDSVLNFGINDEPHSIALIDQEDKSIIILDIDAGTAPFEVVEEDVQVVDLDSDETLDIALETSTNSKSDRYLSVRNIKDSDVTKKVPIIQIVSPTEGQVFNTASIVVSGTARDGVKLTYVNVKVNSVDVPNPIGLIGKIATWETQVTLVEGDNVIEAQSFNVFGVGSTVAKVNVKFEDVTPIEKTSPTVSVIHSPTNPLTTDTVVLNVTASDASGITQIRIYSDGLLKRTCTSSPCTYSGIPPAGLHTYYADATDSYGNVGRDPLTGNKSFSVTQADTQNPTVAITYPTGGSLISNSNIVVSGTSNDDIRVTSVRVRLNQAALWSTAAGTNSWGIPLTLIPGTNVIEAQSFDASGKSSSIASVNVELELGGDETNPTVSVIHSPNNPLTTDTVTLTATASDESGISQIRIFVNDVLTRTCTFTTTCATSARTYSIDTHTYYAEAVDGAGNVGTDPLTGTKSFSVELVSPIYWSDTPMRGIGVGNPGLSKITEADMIKLKGWGVNVLRVHLLSVNPSSYSTLLNELERVVNLAEKYNIRVVVALMSMQGVYGNTVDSPFWTDFSLQEQVIDFWRSAATRFKGRNVIVGFDLINEPAPTADDRGDSCPTNCPATPGTPKDIGYFYSRTIQAIRAIDPDRTAIVESRCYGQLCYKKVNGTYQYAVSMPVLNESNVVYSFHYYLSNYYTHQGISTNVTYNYPGTVPYVGYFDAARTRTEIKKIGDWAQANNAKIFIGEYSVAAWAPNAANWLTDVTNSFEEFGFSTSYHHYNEYQGWNLEYDSITKTYGSTDRLDVMKTYWSLNQGVVVCSNECTTSGARQCSGTTGYQTCGNYDADSCLEWNSVTNCQSGYTCSNGQCITTTSVFFSITGDIQNGAYVPAVSTLIHNKNPEFIVTTGDNNDDALWQTLDDGVGKNYHDYIYPYVGEYGSGSPTGTNRFWPAIGNHDYNLTAHYNYFTLPNNERYYDFVKGPVHFYIINSVSDPDGTTSTSVQATWLKNQLAASTSPWDLVLFHYPPYTSSSNHPPTLGMRWPFKEWGADMVFNGHNHVYERIFYNNMTYIVNGLGGKSIYGWGTITEGSQFRYNSNYGALFVNATSTDIILQFINIAGTMIDTYTLNKAIQEITPPTVSVSHLPTNPLTTDTVTITASASDASGIKQIQIYVDNVNIKTCTSSPCIYSNTFTQGTHTYYATALDNYDNMGVDPLVEKKLFSVTSNDLTSPTLSITHSPPNPTSTQQVTLNVIASDVNTGNSGINEIKIYVDGVVSKTCAFTSACMLSSCTCATTAKIYSVDTHTYYATAKDNAASPNIGTEPSVGTKSFSVTETGYDIRIINHDYPRIGAFQWNGANADWLSRFDLVVQAPDNVNNQNRANSEVIKGLRAKNPNTYVLATTDWNGGAWFRKNLPNEWILKTSSGSNVTVYGTDPFADITDYCKPYTGIVNGYQVYDETYAEALARILAENMNWTLFDGVSSDGSWAGPGGSDVDLDRNGLNDYTETGKGSAWVRQKWYDGNDHARNMLRDYYYQMFGSRDSKLITYWTISGNMSITTANGVGWEAMFINYPITFSSWPSLINTWETFGPLPRINYVAAYNSYAGSLFDKVNSPPILKNYFRYVRWTLGIALLNNAYYVNSGSGSHWANYYDEFDVPLGYPKGSARQLSNGAWIRCFDNGIVIVNPTNTNITVTNAMLQTYSECTGTYYRFKGNQDLVWNNGALFDQVTLLSTSSGRSQNVGEGIILVKQSNFVVASDIIIDNTEVSTSPGSVMATLTGFSSTYASSSNTNYNPVWGTQLFYHTNNYAAANSGAVAVFKPTINVGGQYEVFEWHGGAGQYLTSYTEATNTPVTISHANGVTQKTIDQRNNYGQWNSLGIYNFIAGSNYDVTLTASGANGYVIADAFMWRYVPETGLCNVPSCNGLAQYCSSGQWLTCPTGTQCSNGQCVTSCTNECSPSGATQCSGTTGYQTCGNYDADLCLEWSSVTNCQSGYTCSNGQCTTAIASPSIFFQGQTDLNNAVVNRDNSFVNVSVSDTDLGSAFINWDNSLILWLRLNQESGESSTLFNDWSTYNNDATCIGASCPTYTAGKLGGAYNFDGIDDAMTIQYNNVFSTAFNTNSWTYSVWVKPTLTGASAQDLFEGRYHEPRIAISSGRIQLAGFIGGTYTTLCTASSTLTANAWTHITLTADGTSYRIYYNGAIAATCTFKSIDWPPTLFLIGGRGSEYYTGLMDDILIFNRALSTEEILALYNANNKLYHNFNGLNVGTYNFKAYAQDLSGNVNSTETRTLYVS